MKNKRTTNVEVNCVRQKKGITLVALAVTIIVLLILAGITLTLVMGENGLINKAQNSGKKYTEAEVKEKLQLEIADIQTEKNGNATLEDLDGLKISGYNTSIGDIGRIISVTKDNQKYNYFVDDKMNVQSLENMNVNNQTGNTTEDANRTYLYKENNEYTDITGGWNGYVYQYPGYSKSAGYYNKGEYSLNFGDNDPFAYGDGGFSTTNKIDLSQYSKLCIDFSNIACNFIARSGYPTAFNGYQILMGENIIYDGIYIANTATSGIVEIDLSDKNYNDILKFNSYCFAWGLNGNYIMSCSIQSIWLEK